MNYIRRLLETLRILRKMLWILWKWYGFNYRKLLEWIAATLVFIAFVALVSCAAAFFVMIISISPLTGIFTATLMVTIILMGNYIYKNLT